MAFTQWRLLISGSLYFVSAIWMVYFTLLNLGMVIHSVKHNITFLSLKICKLPTFISSNMQKVLGTNNPQAIGLTPNNYGRNSDIISGYWYTNISLCKLYACGISWKNTKTESTRSLSNKWTKTLYQDYLHIANFCMAVLSIFQKTKHF